MALIRLRWVSSSCGRGKLHSTPAGRSSRGGRIKMRDGFALGGSRCRLFPKSSSGPRCRAWLQLACALSLALSSLDTRGRWASDATCGRPDYNGRRPHSALWWQPPFTHDWVSRGVRLGAPGPSLPQQGSERTSRMTCGTAAIARSVMSRNRTEISLGRSWRTVASPLPIHSIDGLSVVVNGNIV